MRHAPILLALLAALPACTSTGIRPVVKAEGTNEAPAPRRETPRAPTASVSLVARSESRERALTLLAQEAGNPDPQIRANAIEGLASAPGRLESIAALGLKDDNQGVRTVAAMSVGRARVRELRGAVRSLLDDASPYVRAAAIYALVRLGEPVDRTPLASMLLGDPSSRVRAHVAFILGEIGDPSALPLLRQAARRPAARASVIESRLFQLQVAEAMIKLGDDTQIESIRPSLYPSRPEDLEATALAAQIMGEVGDKGAIDELIALTAVWNSEKQKMPAEVRLAAAASLGKLGQRQGWFIADEYASAPSAAVRAQAAHVYSQTDGPDNLTALGGLMGDPDPLVRVAAAAGVVHWLETIPGATASVP